MNPRRRPRLQPELVDALVQSSFIVQSVLAEIAAEYDLSMTQLRLLGILRDRELRMAQLAHVLGLTKSSTTGLVDRAEQRGLVRRMTTSGSGDDRAVSVTLTDHGRALIEAGAPQVGTRLGALLAELPGSDRQRLVASLGVLVRSDASLRGVDLSAGRLATIAERRR